VRSALLCLPRSPCATTAHLLDEGHDVAVFAPTRERVPPTVAASFPLRARARAAAAQLERAECEAQQPRAGARTSVRAQLWALASWVAAGGAGVSRRPAGRFVQVRARSVRCPIFKEYEPATPRASERHAPRPGRGHAA
jgi:hypothetical protein